MRCQWRGPTAGTGPLSGAYLGEQMRKNIHVLASMLFSVVGPAFAGDKITYLACRADNYEHDFLLLVHVGHCEKVSRQLLNSASRHDTRDSWHSGRMTLKSQIRPPFAIVGRA